MKNWKDLSSEELEKRVNEKFQFVVIEGKRCSGIFLFIIPWQTVGRKLLVLYLSDYIYQIIALG